MSENVEAKANGGREMDQVMPQDKWQFDEEVTEAFDDMLRRSIPQHDLMRELCFDLGCNHVQDKTSIVDLGCSRGEALARFVDRFGACNHFVGVEISPPMLAAVRQRYKGLIDCGVMEIKDLDLRRTYPPVAASLTLCVLTLQFVPIEHRHRVVSDVFRSTVSGGALILVEKVLGSSADMDSLLAKRYWQMKEENGYTKDQIDRKKLSLEGVLVPVTARWNEDLLQSAGFSKIECFWRCLNFAGWIAVKN